MLSVNEAKKIGIRACIDKIGYDFCKKNEDNSVAVYGEEDGIMTCFVGVDDAPPKEYDLSKVKSLKLTHGYKWPYYANCGVSMENGAIEYGECRVPLL